MTHQQTTTDMLIKHATIGAASALAYKYGVLTGGSTISVMGRYIPTWQVGLAVGASGSVLADIFHSSVFPQISHAAKHADMLVLGMNSAVAAAVQVGALGLLNKDILADIGILKPAGIGASSEVLGGYVYQHLERGLLEKLNI